MSPTDRSKLSKAILTILGILLAALMGWLAGCRMTWAPSKAELELGWPGRDIELRLGINGATTRPSEPSP